MEPIRLAATTVAITCLAAGIAVAVLPSRHATSTGDRDQRPDARAASPDGASTAVAWWRREHRWRRAGAALAAAVLGLAATGWPAVALLAAAGAWWLPAMLGPDRAGKARQQRAEAIAGWADGLRDVLSAAAGLQQSLLATAGTAPSDIRPLTQQLAARIRAGHQIDVALRSFAADLDHPLGDLVAAALIQASHHQARQLGPLLGRLADTARAHAAAAQRVATTRAASRTTLRIITGTVVGGFVLLLTADRDFLNPYQSATGQLVLLAVGTMFGIGLAWIRKLAVSNDPPHTLAIQDDAPATASDTAAAATARATRHAEAAT